MVSDHENLSASARASVGGAHRDLSLEEIIFIANKIGIEYIDKRRDAERLELMRTVVRSKIMNRIEVQSQKDIPEHRLKRLAEAEPEYQKLLEEIVTMRSESEKLKVRYDSYRHLFEAKRTMISYKKAELRSL